MLDSNRNYKPLDFGNGLTAGSVNDQGRLIALSTPHPQQGYVTLTCVPSFPEDRRYDPAFVRSYRAAFAAPTLAGFGFTFRYTARHASRCSLEANALPRVRLTLADGIVADLVTFAPAMPIAGALQVCTITNEREHPYTLAYQWGGALLLTRASYAQLTEGGPLPRPEDRATVIHDGSLLTINNHGLGWAVAVLGVPHGHISYRHGNEPLNLRLSGTITINPRAQVRLVVAYGFGAHAAEARAQAHALARHDADALLAQTLARWKKLASLVTAPAPQATWLVNRALVYILACCAVPVGETTCLMTDHQLLPLAWTRDAYYQVQALLALRQRAAADPAGALVRATIDDLIRRHVRWLFEVAERPDDSWGRAYLTNGLCKDRVFQLDQQCYPLLEVVEYVEATGDTAIVPRLQPHIDAVLAMLLQRRAPEAWLFPTSETPGDDEVAMPYHLSSQILVWRTFAALARLNARVAVSTLDFAAMAQHVRHAVYEHMVAHHGGARLFAYLADLRGGYQFYHDANDLPTALAPRWGFCAADDPVWRATMEFAFSSANRGGFYAGRFGGLGSVHTPHPWPLGDAQELLVAQLVGDHARHATVWQKLSELACWDGLFPEAYDETTGAVASRHWFAWPGAALAMLALWQTNT